MSPRVHSTWGILEAEIGVCVPRPYFREVTYYIASDAHVDNKDVVE
jgi:hypothetical protein